MSYKNYFYNTSYKKLNIFTSANKVSNENKIISFSLIYNVSNISIFLLQKSKKFPIYNFFYVHLKKYYERIL